MKTIYNHNVILAIPLVLGGSYLAFGPTTTGVLAIILGIIQIVPIKE